MLGFEWRSINSEITITLPVRERPREKERSLENEKLAINMIIIDIAIVEYDSIFASYRGVSIVLHWSLCV